MFDIKKKDACVQFCGQSANFGLRSQWNRVLLVLLHVNCHHWFCENEHFRHILQTKICRLKQNALIYFSRPKTRWKNMKRDTAKHSLRHLDHIDKGHSWMEFSFKTNLVLNQTKICRLELSSFPTASIKNLATK